MNKLIIASAAAALMMGISGSAFAAMSAADCQSLFQRADISKDGSLQADEAKVFLDAMNQAQVKPKDVSMVTKEEFTMACEKDAFANIDPATIGTAASTTATTDQGTTTTEQPATGTTTTTEQSTTTTTEQPAATTEQPATELTTDQTASTTQPTTEQPATTEQALAAPEGIMASDFIGAEVYSGSDEKLGDIKDFILSESGQATRAIIDIGDIDVVVDMPQLKTAVTGSGLKVVLDASKADLGKFPTFKKQ
jgi:hypothetical protein